uniref:F-box/LRR-repeat protein 15 n=1 Tax=Meleagris gallopavo TaxID=9103 RepID=A0A803XNH1_MELGA
MSLTPSRGCLLDLPWEDILVPHILCHLPLQQLLGLQRVSKAFQALVQLYLANMRCFDSSQIGSAVPRAAFLNLLKDNKVLQQLVLQNCSDWLTDGELLPVIMQNHHLHHIQLKGCAQLSCHALMVISLNCPHLRRLSLAHCEWVDSLSLRSLADHCKALEAVDLTACRQLKDEAICYLVQKCSRLKSLSLAVNANVGDVAVEETAKCCPELEHLDLTGCLRVKNDSISYPGPSLVPSLPGLQYRPGTSPAAAPLHPSSHRLPSWSKRQRSDFAEQKYHCKVGKFNLLLSEDSLSL